MLTKVKKWGNSLALRIPKTFAADARLEMDTLVEMIFVDGNIVVKPVRQPAWSLQQLLESITETNIHHEIDAGLPVGKETW